MNERNDQRDLRDQAAKDEAVLRQSQQSSAGAGHYPLEAYPAHGATPTSRSIEASEQLVVAYQLALDAERLAWGAVTALPGELNFAEEAWNSWRTAVEDRDQATRLLINYAITRGSAG